jgi:DtxR family Mn-dependent transcriptional regulator
MKDARQRVVIEDALKHLHDCEYQKQPATVQSLAGAVGVDLDQAADLLRTLESSELVQIAGAAYRLTRKGRSYARHVIRAHRLYETHLAEESGLDERLWHSEAEKMEHRISEERLARLSERLGEPRFDPHGDPIPTPSGELPPLRGVPLPECPAGWEGQVVHVEDEPRAGYEQVISAGLAYGTRFRVTAVDEQSLRLLVEGRAVDLPHQAAAHVRVTELGVGEQFDDSVTRLSTLRPGEAAAVVGLSPACRGPERNRLLDLGIVPGSVVAIDMESPWGNPTAYLVRGASIALRREQSERILVKKV